ncbi:MAG: TIGR01244 family phosphatase [Halomonadaceae bacterium]|nr:MAG: TIGR01244 family phosphatase [Halomonadaceae bacterium]
MEIRTLSPFFSVSPQITPEDVGVIAALGFKTIISNRPDQESESQPDNTLIRAATERAGLDWHHMPVISGNITEQDVDQFQDLIHRANGPVLAFCRTGTRCASLWAMSQARQHDVDAVLQATQAAGYDLTGSRQRLLAQASRGAGNLPQAVRRHDVVIVGGGAGGLATAASLLSRQPDLNIGVIEPAQHHYYQPGWTLVGGGVFDRAQTARPMSQVMPKAVHWHQTAVAQFEPAAREVVLEDGERIGYRILVVSPGLKLNWEAIPGLQESLGSHGVTSNYRFDLAPYTWELVQHLKQGTALFTQPPMPIKCAGAPQKAMYLACNHWQRNNRLGQINTEFCTAGAALFGVQDYVPALMEYVERYNIQLAFQNTLLQVDGPGKRAVFARSKANGEVEHIEKAFDMIHVCPPQIAPDLIRNSPLANAEGWLDVSPETLQHNQYGDIFGLGDGAGTPNAKTAAAVRKQAPVVAENVLAALEGQPLRSIYDGYGSCPLTVERGRIVLAEFTYGGKLAPSFPSWLINGTRPSRLAWLLKEKMLPWLYWQGMLKGHEWLAAPKRLPHEPNRHEAVPACDFKEPRQP